MPKISNVTDIKPKLTLVEDVKPKLTLVEDVKPKMETVDGETETYIQPWVINANEPMGLLLCLTYVADESGTKTRI